MRPLDSPLGVSTAEFWALTQGDSAPEPLDAVGEAATLEGAAAPSPALSLCSATKCVVWPLEDGRCKCFRDRRRFTNKESCRDV